MFQGLPGIWVIVKSCMPFHECNNWSYYKTSVFSPSVCESNGWKYQFTLLYLLFHSKNCMVVWVLCYIVWFGLVKKAKCLMIIWKCSSLWWCIPSFPPWDALWSQKCSFWPQPWSKTPRLSFSWVYQKHCLLLRT